MAASQQSGWRQQIHKWTTPSRLAAIVLFLAVAFLLEYLIVYASMSFGLTDTSPLVWQVTSSFAISVSPLFHLLPLTVIIVLFFSWIHLTKHVAVTRYKAEPTLTRPQPRKIEKVRFRTLRRYYKRIAKRLGDAERRIKAALLDNRLANYLRRAVIKSAWTVMLPFVALALLIYLIAYPRLIPDTAAGVLEGANSALIGFVMWTINGTNWLGQALSPLGWIAANINNGLAASSPGFRNGIIALTTPIVKPLINLDLVGKYVLAQNLAAWFSALTALHYAQYAHRPVIRRK